MSEIEKMLADCAERLFGREVSIAQIEAAEKGEWPASLWRTVEESGLLRVFVGEEQGGADASWQEALPALLAASRALAPIPFIDTAVCCWLLQRLGITMVDGPIGLAEIDADSTVRQIDGRWHFHGKLQAPWGRHVGHVLARGQEKSHLGGPVWLLLSTAGCRVEIGNNLAGEPRDCLVFDNAQVVEAVAAESWLSDPVDATVAPKALGALVRAIQMVGVLERVLDQTVQYANERTQFGRPIGKFQAIQQQLAVSANEVVAARMAVANACVAVGAAGWEYQAMVAKIICGQAAGQVAAIAHQVHGALGFTYEHSLHFATRRLWSWRAEYGSEAHWARAIGERAIRLGGAALWQDITGTLVT